MPRFSIDSSPPPEKRRQQFSEFSAGAAAPSTTSSAAVSSKLLSCLSHDGRSVHLVHGNRIETHALPLAGTTEDSVAKVPIISTPLPATLDASKVVEVMCVEGDSSRKPLPEFIQEKKYTILPLLCVYTRHAVLLLKIGYEEEQNMEQPTIVGSVLSVTEPFLTDLVSCQVVRVRPAPHRRLGYATFCPANSIVALCRSDAGESYQLLVYHAESNQVTQPLTIGTEAVLEEPEFVDFSFAQSNAQSLLVTLSIHLVRSSGDVYGASPIVIDGAMVPTKLHQEACDMLHSYADAKELVKYRQCRAGLHFLQEAFEAQGNGEFMVMRLQGGNTNRSTLWPVQIQGPLLLSSASAASCCEPYFARNLVGLAVAGAGGVQLCVTPPTALLPRFAFEDPQDGGMIDQQLLAMVVEHVTDMPCSALVRDPALDTMIHCVSDRGVTTLTSHAMRQFSASLSSPSRQPQPNTKAWMAVEVPPDVSVHGAVVSGDALLGHVLIVYLSSGQLTAINLTETRVRYESTAAAPAPKPKMDEALQTMEATPAFHEQLGPVVEKIETALLKMTKLVGTSTDPKDIDAGLLASALSVRQRCEQDLVVHLKCLDKMKQIRLSELRKVVKGQVAQLQSIQESLKQAKAKTKSVRGRMEQLETDSKSLVQRCSTVLQASQDLRPALTDADRQYFALLQRTQKQCDQWDDQVEHLKHAARNVDVTDAGNKIRLSPQEQADVHTLLRGQRSVIDETVDRVTATGELVAELVHQAGVVGDPYEGQ